MSYPFGIKTGQAIKSWKIITVGVFALAVGFFVFIPGFGEAAVGDNMTGYAWSDNIGWVNFNSGSYGVRVDATGLMSGYAWSDNIGWITFNSNQLSGCATAPCEVRFNKVTGMVTGWARVCSGMSDTSSNSLYPNQTNPNNTCGGVSRTDGWDGWIQLRGASGNYGITVTGCNWDGWAWGGNVVGWIHFRGPTANYAVVGTDANSCQSIGVPTLRVIPVSETVAVNQTQQFYAMFDPDGSTGPSPESSVGSGTTWVSSNTAVATIVSTTGLATGRAAGGPVVMTVTYDPDGTGPQVPLSAGGTLNVIAVVTPTFSVTPAFASIYVGNTQQFTAMYDQDGLGAAFTPQPVTTGVVWYSSATSTASIGLATGLATGNLIGNATMSAHYSGLSGTGWLNVTSPPTPSLTIIPATQSIAVGGSQQYMAMYNDGIGNTTIINHNSSSTIKAATVWRSGSPAVAEMIATGFGLAVGRSAGGPIDIEVTYQGRTAIGKLTVTGGTPPLTPTVLLQVKPETSMNPPVYGSTALIARGEKVYFKSTLANVSGCTVTGGTSTQLGGIKKSLLATVPGAEVLSGDFGTNGAHTFTLTCGALSSSVVITVTTEGDSCQIILQDSSGSPLPNPLKFTVPLISNRLVYISGTGFSINDLALDTATTPGLEISSRDSAMNTLTLHATSPTRIGLFTGTIKSTGPVCAAATFTYEIAEQGDPGEF